MGSWIDSLIRAAAALRPARQVALPAGAVRVNVGSGIEVADGWINLDGGLHALLAGAPRPLLSLAYRRTRTVSRLRSEQDYVTLLKQHRFVFHNIERGLPFPADSVDFIYCSHLLEHLDRQHARDLAHEMLRVLKPGGCARICVPDLAKAIDLYARGARHEALEYFFTDGRPGSCDQHRYMYDFELLQELLREVGFVNVIRYEYRVGTVPDIDKLDNRPEQTLYVEANKVTSLR